MLRKVIGGRLCMTLTFGMALATWLVGTPPAEASNCSPFTYTLTNGTTADASQVMTNFNTLMDCANNNLLPVSGGTLSGTTTLPGPGVITSTGIVGIGTTSPYSSSSLDVRGAIDSGSSTYDTYGFFYPLDSNTFAIEAHNYANNAKRNIIIDAWGGYVGIGTTSPINSLTVAGQGAGIAQLGTSGCGPDFVALTLGQTVAATCANYNIASSPTGSQDLFINRPNGQAIRFREGNGAEEMFIAAGGYVGIGTATPGYPLQINGEAAATSFVNTSDRRLKTDIKPLDLNALNIVARLKPVTFQWKEPKNEMTG